MTPNNEINSFVKQKESVQKRIEALQNYLEKLGTTAHSLLTLNGVTTVENFFASAILNDIHSEQNPKNIENLLKELNGAAPITTIKSHQQLDSELKQVSKLLTEYQKKLVDLKVPTIEAVAQNDLSSKLQNLGSLFANLSQTGSAENTKNLTLSTMPKTNDLSKFKNISSPTVSENSINTEDKDANTKTRLR